MHQKNGALVILVCSLLVLSGCASRMDMRTQGVASEIVIFVNADGTVTPDTAYVDNPSQDVVWIACSGTPNVEFENKTMPKPLPDPAKRRAHVKIPPGHKGEQKYSVTLTMASGETQTIDPIIIVQY